MADFDHNLLDDVIHSRARLAIMAMLASVDTAEFSYLRDQTKTADGALSKHLTKLTEAGYIEASTRRGQFKAVTDYSLTRKGRAAFSSYLAHLESIVSAVKTGRK